MEVKTKVNGIQPAKCNAGSRGGSLCATQDGYQLSNDWILGRLDSSGLSESDKNAIRETIEDPSNGDIKVTRYLARVSKNKVEYHQFKPIGDDDIGANPGGNANLNYNHTLKKW